MVKFDYLPDGRVASVKDTFSAFNEPTVPISAEVTLLTGITDEMVAGHRIDEGAPALALLLETARKATVRVWAEQSPFELKDSLKRRGYRWSDGSDGRSKSWYVDVCETVLQDEIAFLRTEIYLRDVEPRLQNLTAFTRFSARI
jgi:hypothetical protein